MAAVGTAVNFKISPTNAAGLPAPIARAMWESNGAGTLSVAADFLSASYVPADTDAGKSVLVAVSGKSLLDRDIPTESVTFAVEGVAVPPPPPPDTEAVKVNLAIV